MEPDKPTLSNQTITEPAPPPTTTTPPPTPISPTEQKGKANFKLPVVIIAIIVVLLGASAAAYFGIVVPNKPENKLIAAFGNLAKKKQSTLSGKLDIENSDQSAGGLSGFALDYIIKSDVERNSFGFSGTLGVSGAQFPFELRSIDDDLYVKIDGLSSLDDSVNANELGEEGALYAQLLSRLDNQWYVIDRSYLQELSKSNSCFDDITLALSNEDIGKIEAAYRKYPLFTIKNTSKVDVDGVSTTKFELEPSDRQTAENFTKELGSLAIIKKLKECGDDSGVSTDTDEEADDDSTAVFNVYVTGDREVKKLEITTKSQESELTLTINFAFGPVDIGKPAGAKPIQEILGNLFGGDLEVSTPSQGTPVGPAQSPTPYFE